MKLMRTIHRSGCLALKCEDVFSYPDLFLRIKPPTPPMPHRRAKIEEGSGTGVQRIACAQPNASVEDPTI